MTKGLNLVKSLWGITFSLILLPKFRVGANHDRLGYEKDGIRVMGS